MPSLSTFVQPQLDRAVQEWVQRLELRFRPDELVLNLRCHVKVQLWERDGRRDHFDVSFNPPGWSLDRSARGGDDWVLEYSRRTFRPQDDEIDVPRTAGIRESFRATPSYGGRVWDLELRHAHPAIRITDERFDDSGEVEEYYTMVYVYNDLSPIVMFSPEASGDLEQLRPVPR